MLHIMFYQCSKSDNDIHVTEFTDDTVSNHCRFTIDKSSFRL